MPPQRAGGAAAHRHCHGPRPGGIHQPGAMCSRGAPLAQAGGRPHRSARRGPSTAPQGVPRRQAGRRWQALRRRPRRLQQAAARLPRVAGCLAAPRRCTAPPPAPWVSEPTRSRPAITVAAARNLRSRRRALWRAMDSMHVRRCPSKPDRGCIAWHCWQKRMVPSGIVTCGETWCSTQTLGAKRGEVQACRSRRTSRSFSPGTLAIVAAAVQRHAAAGDATH